MDEREWLTNCDPESMLQFLRVRSSHRKLRLFTCACCRRVWHLLITQESKVAVETAEQFVDGLVTRKVLDAVASAARNAAWGTHHELRADQEFFDAAWAAAAAAGTGSLSDDLVSLPDQAAVLRCIFGNPFRPVTVNPAWLTPTVVSLAQAPYDERILPSGELDRERLLVLADALEDAGCTEAQVLDHLRGPGPHVRGCFVVDLCLQKR